MGIASSSALRDENAGNGPAYGSLETLGARPKPKKKPVLVLDPDELAQAHAMFQDASAELMGEEVERPQRPATILGLAPMEDDDLEEMGQSDEPDAEDDDAVPNAEDVLSLTRRKSAPVLDHGLDDAIANDLRMQTPDADQIAASGTDPISGDDDFGGYADPDGPIEDDIDLENRIFPSLPVQPELAETESEPAEAEAAQTPPAQPVVPAEPEMSASAEPKIAEEIPQQTSSLESLQARLAKRDAENQSHDFETTEPGAIEKPNSRASHFAPSREDVEELRQRHSKDWFELDRDDVEKRELQAWADENWQNDKPASSENRVDARETDKPRATAPEPMEPRPAPARPEPKQSSDFAPPPPVQMQPPAQNAESEPEPQPKPAVPTPVASDKDRWEEAKPAAPMAESADHISPESTEVAGDNAATADISDESYTLTDDDQTDGYAFMRDPRSRRSAVTATPQGRQSALRAKLLRDAEREAAEKAARQSRASNSVVLRFWNWLRGLFG
ncbi:hypothetical protein [Aurantiacibacter sediminis]|uniref:Uncharacterized protein n=1 Tax=Aurantiacibacter sediminis TaxID=2793064 RepID=A0ABS0N558_9SPHN|nr:hypothetical protein [Aurantiacibacter sediminis]MBH5322936.1 hypothetical protein [Aurantiacibacter sediminis]